MDEEMLKCIGNPKGYHSDSINLHIYDARSYLATMGNKLKGKGTESSDHYKNATIYFLDIENIHHVRECHKLLIAAFESYFCNINLHLK